MSKLTIWLTPIWILAVGVTIGALILLLMWGVTWVVNRRAARSIAEAVSEGILRPISYVVISMAAARRCSRVPRCQSTKSSRRSSGFPTWRPIVEKIEVGPRKADVEVPAAFRAERAAELHDYQRPRTCGERRGEEGLPRAADSGAGGRALRVGARSSTPRAFEGDVSTLYHHQ